MNPPSIGFIGGGNMARSLIGGLLADHYPAERIAVSEPNPELRATLQRDYGIEASDNNSRVAATADVVVLATKPQVLHAVASELAATIQSRRPLVVSIAAGVRSQDLDRWLGGNCAIVRTMPNTPAMIGCGATGMFANDRVDATARGVAESILRAVGLTLWVENETQLDAVTALSGSGPAYFFLVLEALQQAGTELGLSAETARLLALQTAYGAAKMALESSEDAATLRRRVTSPGGTTEQAIKVFEENGLRDLFSRALAAANHRSQELATLLGEK